MYQLICSDIDGTLLDAHHSVSATTISTFQKLYQRNIPIVLASGRFPYAMRPIRDLLGISGYLISYNGALIHDETTAVRKRIFSQPMPLNLVIPIYQKAKARGHKVSIFNDDYWYIEKMEKWVDYEMELIKATPTLAMYGAIFKKWEQTNDGSHKMMIVSDSKEATDDFQQWLQLHFADLLNIYRSVDTYIEISLKSVSKATALQYVSKHLEIPQEKIIAFGDNYNDIEMIKWVGHGVAVANARPALLKIANDVTLSNIEDGVAEYLNTWLDEQ